MHFGETGKHRFLIFRVDKTLTCTGYDLTSPPYPKLSPHAWDRFVGCHHSTLVPASVLVSLSTALNRLISMLKSLILGRIAKAAKHRELLLIFRCLDKSLEQPMTHPGPLHEQETFLYCFPSVISSCKMSPAGMLQIPVSFCKIHFSFFFPPPLLHLHQISAPQGNLSYLYSIIFIIGLGRKTEGEV